MILRHLRPLLLATLAPSLLFAFPGADPLYAAAGDLDCRFGTGGTLQLDLGPASPILDLALQSSGKIVALGSDSSSIRLTRFLEGGTLDPTFGTSGSLLFSFPDPVDVSVLAVDHLDRIAVTGEVDVDGDSEVFVARFTAEGELDLSFGSGDGWTSFDFTAETSAAGTERGDTLVVDSVNRLLVGGSPDANGGIFNPSNRNMAVARLDTDGELDLSFGIGGVALASSPGDATDDELRGLTLDSAGRIIAAGFTGQIPFRDTMVVRWLPEGTLDNTFDGNGVAFIDLSETGDDDIGFDVAVSGADQIVVLSVTGGHPALARLTHTGDLDSTFATDGILQQAFIDGQDVTRNVLVQSNGKILVTGFALTDLRFDFAVMRITADGQLDTTWASPDGVKITNIGFRNNTIGTIDHNNAALLQPDGKVILAGSSDIQAGSLARYLDDFNANGPATTLMITSDTPDPSLNNELVHVSYTITSPAGTPSGDIRIWDGTRSCTGTIAEGGCDITLSRVGERTLTAAFFGDGEFCPSSDTTEHFVAARSQTFFAHTFPNPSVVGEPVTARVLVNSLVGGVGPPTGTVSIDDGNGASCSAPIVEGEASCVLTSFVASTRQWNASYSGDEVFAASSGFKFHVVERAVTSTQITALTPTPSVVPEPVRVDVTVSVEPPGSGTLDGEVQIDDGAGATCVVLLTDGSGSCELVPMEFGDRDITATFPGDFRFTSSQDSEAHQFFGIDFGDAPATFPTLAVDGGASHALGSGLFLGATVDSELDGQPSPLAMGDDGPGDDEDGVTFMGPAVPGGSLTVRVEASAPGLLDAWIDLDGSGSWDEETERIFAAEPVVQGPNDFALHLPPTAIPDPVVSRFRISSAGVPGAGGSAPDGEVEDHLLTIQSAEIDVAYDVSPGSVPETGGLLTFSTSVQNLGEVELQLTQLMSTTFGDLQGLGDCSLPQTIDVEGSYSCTFESFLSGNSGASSDSVTAEAAVAGTTRTANSQALFTFTDTLPSMGLEILADPATVTEPQGEVLLALEVRNQQSEELLLESLTDDLIGDLHGVGSCVLPQTLAANATYTCAYDALIAGEAGDSVIRSVSGSGRDDESNTTTAGNETTITVTDGIAPQVLLVSSLDGMPISNCETIRTPIQGLLVTFDEPVVGADQTASYLAVAAGPDADLSTADCQEGTSGDDISLALVSAVSDGDPQTPTITLTFEESAPQSLLGFLVCPEVEDEAGNAVQTNRLTFRLDTENRFLNGTFDVCPTTLEPWQASATAPNEVFPDSQEDVDSSSLSGSARVLSTSVEPTTLSQCVDMASNQDFEIGLSTRIDPLQTATATLSISCDFFDQAACAGQVVGEQVTATPMPAQPGAWAELGFPFVSPSSTLSALCHFAVAANDSRDPDFDAYLDGLFLGTTGLIFRDGFESGDISGWSSGVGWQEGIGWKDGAGWQDGAGWTNP